MGPIIRGDGKPFKGYYVTGSTLGAYRAAEGDALLLATGPRGVSILDPEAIGLPCEPGTFVRADSREEADRLAWALLLATDWTSVSGPGGLS